MFNKNCEKENPVAVHTDLKNVDLKITLLLCPNSVNLSLRFSRWGKE